MTINLEWLDACGNMRSAIEQSQNILSNMEAPHFADKNMMPKIHALLQPHLASYDKSTAIRAELLVLLYLFAPSRLTQQKQGRFQIMTDIACVMGLNRNNAYMYKVALMDYYRWYKDFRAIVDFCLNIVAEAYPSQIR